MGSSDRFKNDTKTSSGQSPVNVTKVPQKVQGDFEDPNLAASLVAGKDRFAALLQALPNAGFAQLLGGRSGPVAIGRR